MRRNILSQNGFLLTSAILLTWLSGILRPEANSQVSNLPNSGGTERKTPRELYQEALASYGRFDSYLARYVQREPTKNEGKDEILAFSFRKKPWSVRFKWLNGEGEGREMLYVKGRNDDKIYGILALGDVPLLPAGHMLSVKSDSALAKRASNKPITESGIGAMIERFARSLSEKDASAH